MCDVCESAECGIAKGCRALERVITMMVAEQFQNICTFWEQAISMVKVMHPATSFTLTVELTCRTPQSIEERHDSGTMGETFVDSVCHLLQHCIGPEGQYASEAVDKHSTDRLRGIFD